MAKALFENEIDYVPKYLNSEQLAKTLGVSIHTVRAWRKFRVITPIKFGRSVRWLLDDVVQELSKKRRPK